MFIFWYSFEFNAITYIITQCTSCVNSVATTNIATIYTIITVNLLAANSTKPYSYRKRKSERDTVEVTRYSYGLWNIDTIIMGYKIAYRLTYVGEMKFVDRSTNITS